MQITTKFSARLWKFALAIYLALATAANLYTWRVGMSGAEQSEFAGLTLVLLGLPWSAWFSSFNPHLLSDSYTNSMLVEDLFIALNAVLIPVSGWVVGRIVMRRR